MEVRKKSTNPDPRRMGRKLDNSHLVWQVTKFMYEGMSDSKLMRVLKDRYSFSVSRPNIAGFRRNFYKDRLKQLKKDSEEFQNKQTIKIRSFIDESLSQAASMKEAVDIMERQIEFLEKELNFSNKFDSIFQNAFDSYVNSYDPDNPDKFLKGEGKSSEEMTLSHIIDNMGEEGFLVLQSYCASRKPHDLLKLLALLKGKVLDQRNSIFKIHKEIFKGYRNFSIMQELATVFEKYNGIIIQEFFPNKNTMDRKKYLQVRKRILSLYDELQVRYGAMTEPQQQEPSEAEVQDTVKKLEADHSPVKAVPESEGQDLHNALPNTHKKIIEGKTPKEKKKNSKKAKNKDKSLIEEIEPEILSDEQANAIIEEAEAAYRARKKVGTLDNLFSTIANDADETETLINDFDEQTNNFQQKTDFNKDELPETPNN